MVKYTGKSASVQGRECELFGNSVWGGWWAVSCCGARKNLRAYAFPRFFRPLPLAPLPSSATGGGRVAPPLETTNHFVIMTRWRLVCIFFALQRKLWFGRGPARPPTVHRTVGTDFRVSKGSKKDRQQKLSVLFGDPLETRTPDPLLKRQLLYRLS